MHCRKMWYDWVILRTIIRTIIGLKCLLFIKTCLKLKSDKLSRNSSKD